MIQHHGLFGWGSAFFAVISAVSFWQHVAFAGTIVSIVISVTLGCISLYDRVKYGPRALR